MSHFLDILLCISLCPLLLTKRAFGNSYGNLKSRMNPMFFLIVLPFKVKKKSVHISLWISPSLLTIVLMMNALDVQKQNKWEKVLLKWKKKITTYKLPHILFFCHMLQKIHLVYFLVLGCVVVGGVMWGGLHPKYQTSFHDSFGSHTPQHFHEWLLGSWEMLACSLSVQLQNTGENGRAAAL